MAEVFKGRVSGAAGFEKIVAIKRILPHLSEDQEFITMFVDEAKLSANLNHSNIGQVFEFGKIESRYFIAMEYIHGKDLRRIQDYFQSFSKSMPVPMAIRIMLEVCNALEYAHSKIDDAGQLLRIVHRDISPQNVLISYEGAVKLIDFGIAKALSRSTKTAAGNLKGKFSYMSPEQVDGAEVDGRSDLFALGTVLFELVTGKPLFAGDTELSTLEMVRTGQVTVPSSVNPSVPKALDPVILKALARRPEDRYRRAEEMHEALERFAQTARMTFSAKQLSRWMKNTFAAELENEESISRREVSAVRTSQSPAKRIGAPQAMAAAPISPAALTGPARAPVPPAAQFPAGAPGAAPRPVQPPSGPRAAPGPPSLRPAPSDPPAGATPSPGGSLLGGVPSRRPLSPSSKRAAPVVSDAKGPPSGRPEGGTGPRATVWGIGPVPRPKTGEAGVPGGPRVVTFGKPGATPAPQARSPETLPDDTLSDGATRVSTASAEIAASIASTPAPARPSRLAAGVPSFGPESLLGELSDRELGDQVDTFSQIERALSPSGPAPSDDRRRGQQQAEVVIGPSGRVVQVQGCEPIPTVSDQAPTIIPGRVGATDLAAGATASAGPRATGPAWPKPSSGPLSPLPAVASGPTPGGVHSGLDDLDDGPTMIDADAAERFREILQHQERPAGRTAGAAPRSLRLAPVSAVPAPDKHAPRVPPSPNVPPLQQRPATAPPIVGTHLARNERSSPAAPQVGVPDTRPPSVPPRAMAPVRRPAPESRRRPATDRGISPAPSMGEAPKLSAPIPSSTAGAPLFRGEAQPVSPDDEMEPPQQRWVYWAKRGGAVAVVLAGAGLVYYFAAYRHHAGRPPRVVSGAGPEVGIPSADMKKHGTTSPSARDSRYPEVRPTSKPEPSDNDPKKQAARVTEGPEEPGDTDSVAEPKLPVPPKVVTPPKPKKPHKRDEPAPKKPHKRDEPAPKKGSTPAPKAISTKRKGFLVASSNPRARVYVDGADTGRTTPIPPTNPLSLGPGAHKITFEVNKRRFTFSVVIKTGATAQLIQTLPVKTK
jgi:serine/threonine protein kinase